MPKLIFTQEEINAYLKDNNKNFYHHYYEECKDKAYNLAVHADGLYPEKLIDERRPNEPLEVKEYRKIIWQPKTKPTVSKVLVELQKIRRSSEWGIKYDLSVFTRITEEDNLESYCEKDYPEYGSLTAWAFTLLLRKSMIDPNAAVFVLPENFNVESTEYLNPVAHIYDSCNVIDYVPGDYAVLNNVEGSELYYNRSKKERGKSIYIVTTQQILKYDQVDNKGNFSLTLEIEHGLPELPVRTLKGELVSQVGKNYLYESRINGMLPELNEAAREYSDLQASKVLHIYAERWEYTQNECTTCKGTGTRRNPNWFEGCGAEVVAEVSCNAPGCQRGYVATGPYGKILVRPLNTMESNGGNANIPMPPAGYIQKDVDIVKIQDEGVDKHLYTALSAINFEFLAQTPISQSGVAKSVDMDALNNTVHAIAEDIVSVLDSVYKYIAYYRYKDLYSFDDIDKMLPSVSVPEKYDILTSARTMDEISTGKTSKVNPVIISALEVDYSTKRFSNDPEVRDAVMLILELDPLPNISEDDKMARLMNKGITLETYVISSNIQSFVEKAVTEVKGFVKLSVDKQKAQMAKYAVEVMNTNSPVTALIDGAAATGISNNTNQVAQ